MLPTEFQVNWPFGSGEETKNRFSRWPPSHGGHLGFPNEMVLAFFGSTNHSYASCKVLSQVAHGCRRSRLLKQIVDAARRTTDTDRSQKLTLTIEIGPLAMEKRSFKRFSIFSSDDFFRNFGEGG